MSNYDSDTESIEEIESDALIGFVDVAISEKEQPLLEDTFIGSHPYWLHPNSPPSSDLLLCKNCSSPMTLFLQCSANLEGTYYDRVIYLFGCNKHQCRRKKGSVRVLRGEKRDDETIKARKEEERKEQERLQKIREERERKELEKKELTKNLFGADSNANTNPFGGNPFSSSKSNPNPFGSPNSSSSSKKDSLEDFKKDIKQFEKSKELSYSDATRGKHVHAKKLTKTLDIKLPEFPGFILYFEPEILDPKKQVLIPLPDNLKFNEENDEGQLNLPTLNTENNNKESDELVKMFDDPTFQNFSNIVSYNTQQVLRYSLNGKPVLYTSKDDVSRIFSDNGKLKESSKWAIPKPGFNPSGERRFELQLMPKAIIDLESADDIDILKDGMEWGTIIVATDKDDIIPKAWFDENGVAYVEEWCGVQWEEEIKR